MIQPGTRFAHYEVVSALGKGGMGEVWKAKDTKLGREVAIKTLPEEFANDADRLARFEREAKLLASLNHTNIGHIYAIEETEGTKALVLELVEGPTLADRIARGPISLDEALPIAKQIVEALEAAHEAGVIHRDLKPANVKVRNDGTVKVLDFGLAKAVADEEADLNLSNFPTLSIEATRPGMILGTVPYMSPEQAKGRTVDKRADVWAFGCVLFEMLTGRQPFAGASPAELMSAILRDEPPSLASIRPELPESLREVIEHCLRKDPAGRPQTLRDLQLRLASIERRNAFSDRAVTAAEGSIAVLPFVNMSADAENAYFSDGLTEEIINALTKLPGLRVIARTSAFRFRGEQDLRKVGEALAVRAVLEGSVRRAGNRLRITAQLIDVRDDSHLWSERFDRELTDVFAVQDEIAAAIVEQLDPSLGGTEPGKRPGRRPTKSMEAYEALLEGRHHWNRFTPVGARKALECYERALALDPDYADALVDMALYDSVVAWMFSDPRDPLIRMNTLAAQALALDPDHGEAYGALAFGVLWSEWNWSAADRLFRRAIVLAPASANNLALYGVLYYLGQGAFEEATTYIGRGLELDPLAGRIRSLQGRVLTCERRFEEAEVWCRRALELDPAQLLTVLELVWALVFQHKTDEALAIVREAIDTHGTVKALTPLLGFVHAMAGRRDDAFHVLQSLDETGRTQYATPFTAVAVYAALGELDAAFEWAAKSIEERDLMMLYLRVHPVFEPLRADARYPQLLNRVNLA